MYWECTYVLIQMLVFLQTFLWEEKYDMFVENVFYLANEQTIYVSEIIFSKCI